MFGVPPEHRNSVLHLPQRDHHPWTATRQPDPKFEPTFNLQMAEIEQALQWAAPSGLSVAVFVSNNDRASRAAGKSTVRPIGSTPRAAALRASSTSDQGRATPAIRRPPSISGQCHPSRSRRTHPNPSSNGSVRMFNGIPNSSIRPIMAAGPPSSSWLNNQLPIQAPTSIKAGRSPTVTPTAWSDRDQGWATSGHQLETMITTKQRMPKPSDDRCSLARTQITTDSSEPKSAPSVVVFQFNTIGTQCSRVSV
ncbi:hypothetical protein ACLOJK_014712 [Asimina triloba]